MCAWPNSNFTNVCFFGGIIRVLEAFALLFQTNYGFASLCSSFFLDELWFCKPLPSYVRGIRVLQVFAFVRRIRVLQMFALFSCKLEFYKCLLFFNANQRFATFASFFICYAFVFVLFVISVRIIYILATNPFLINKPPLTGHLYLLSTCSTCNQ